MYTRSRRKTPRLATSVLLLLTCVMPGRMSGAPYPPPPDDLSPSLPQTHLIHTEISWDFGDVAPPDWRWELTSSDPTASFRLRWRHAGPEFDHAVLVVSDANGVLQGEVALPLGVVFGDGYRYTNIMIGDLPAAPTVLLGVEVRNSADGPLGSLSNRVQISAAPAADPFLYTPLAILGIWQSTAVPGLSGAVRCDRTSEERIWSTGVRKFDGGAGPVASSDLWHIGSNTKAFTATVIGKLIQNGTPLPFPSTDSLDWDTPIAEIFPEWAADIRPRFQFTTIRHLACHRSGLRMTGAENDATRALGPGTLNEDPTTGRRVMTRQLLTREHEEDGSPTMYGDRWFYGSGNYLILGAVIEQLTGQTYEIAMRNLLFNPLFITTAGFGMPRHVAYNQPHGHQRLVLFPHETVVDNYPLEPIWNPAGGIYLSQSDWLKFCQLHIDGTEGVLTLDTATLAELHTPHPREFPGDPPEGIDDPSYGWGWGIGTGGLSGGTVLGHDGTFFRFYARHVVFVGDKFAVVTATNIGAGYGYGDLAVNMLSNHLIERMLAKLGRISTMAGTLLGGSGESTGILSLPAPEDDTRYDLKAVFPPPPPSVTLGDFFTPAPLAAHDAYAQTLATYLRAPKVRSFQQTTPEQFLLIFSSEKGALYNLSRSTTLRNANWRQVEQVTGRSGQTAILVDRFPDAQSGFFRIQDAFP